MEKSASTVTDPPCVTAINSLPPPLSGKSNNNKYQEDFAASFASLYDSIFSPESQFPSSLSLSPSPPSSSSPLSHVDNTTEHRLHQAKLILEYDELNEHYEFSLRRLQSLITELDSLHNENAALRHENSDLLNRIHISVSSSSISHRSYRQQILDFGSQNVVSKHCRRRNNPERNSLPKSISVRSPEYLKITPGSHGCGGADHQTSQLSSDSVIFPS